MSGTCPRPVAAALALVPDKAVDRRSRCAPDLHWPCLPDLPKPSLSAKFALFLSPKTRRPTRIEPARASIASPAPPAGQWARVRGSAVANGGRKGPGVEPKPDERLLRQPEPMPSGNLVVATGGNTIL